MRTLGGLLLMVAACLTPVARGDEPGAGKSGAGGVVAGGAAVASAAESTPEIAADEPYANEFSLERAAHYLDDAALSWQRTQACTSCHTMLPYLMARSALSGVSPPSSEVRLFFEDIVAGKREAMPDYACDDVAGAVAVGVASAMALNDRWGTGHLHPLTRRALDQMWTLQRADGGWTWPFRDTPPLKCDEHYGVTLAAIGAGMAPDDYAHTPQAKTGLEGVRRFLKKTNAVSLHQKTMLLWASVYVDDLLAVADQQQILTSLLDAQRPDGGWSMATLVDNANDPSLEAGRVNRGEAGARLWKRVSGVHRAREDLSEFACKRRICDWPRDLRGSSGRAAGQRSTPRARNRLAETQPAGERPVVYTLAGMAHPASDCQRRHGLRGARALCV